LGNQIEELNLFEDAYTLEVSSPGVDIPLTFRRQYLKNIGRELKVMLLDDSEKKGLLKAVHETSIEIEEVVKQKKVKWLKPGEAPSAPETQILTLALDQIKKAQVLVIFK
jgi:ribosome maturation factor RimP